MHKDQKDLRDQHQQVQEVHKVLKELKGLRPLVHKDRLVLKEPKVVKAHLRQVLQGLLVLRVHKDRLQLGQQEL